MTISGSLDAVYLQQLRGSLNDLHDRGLINGHALVSMLRDLVEGQPLSRDHLTAIFGVPVEELLASPRTPLDRARLRRSLDDIGDILLTTEESNRIVAGVPDCVRAQLLLVTALREFLL